MNKTAWREFLGDWNRDLHSALARQAEADAWFGEAGASPQELGQLETRLGVTLPPSYRAFLAVSNGFRQPGNFVPRIFSTAEADWLKNVEDNGIQEWIQREQAAGRDVQVPDEKYFVYGPLQLPETMRSEYLWQALQVSEIETGGTAVYLLNSAVRFPDGEWEAWVWAHWLPGAWRFRSFWDLMQAQRQSFMEVEGE